ncbi:tudor domain-containing protein qin isoform X2 [Megalopta genalis]|uniref:tudor domain-containing protein qin isoform X2 n=1 Tax=Megalopta genalis TaxID=115081 RepID=UPI003FD055D5
MVLLWCVNFERCVASEQCVFERIDCVESNILFKKMFVPRHEDKYHRNYNFPPTKLRNVYCTHCKHQFYVEAFVPLHGTVPLLMECGHVICDKCAKGTSNNTCSLCNVVFQTKNNKTVLLPLNMYTLGLMVVSHNRPINVDDSNISFSKPITSNSKQHRMQGLCHECGIQAIVKCPQCDALYCMSCYAKIHGRALNSHTKIILSDIQNDDSCIVQNTCSEQCKEALEYYCENCEIAGCPHCMLNSHKNHNYISLLDKNQLFLEDFQQMFECVVQRLLRVRQAQKKLKASDITSKKIQDAKNMETIITQHFCYLHGVLQNMEKNIIDSVHQQYNNLHKNIEEISLQLKEHEDHLRNVLHVIVPVEENLDKIDIQRVLTKLKKVIDIPCHLLESSESSDAEMRFDVDENIVDTLQKHCTIRIPTISSFSLQRTELLPDDYEMEPLTEEINIPKFQRDRTFSEIKPVSSVVSLPTRKSDDYPEIGCSEMIRVTHVVDPFCFYVQLMQNQNKITQLAQDLMKVANNSGVIPIDVKINTMYIVQSAKERAWLRGRVIDKKTDCNNEEKYTIYFVDYGTEEQNVSLARMRNIDTHLARIPILALRCALCKIVPNGNQWNATAIQTFKKLVCTNTMVSMSVSSVIGDTYYVDICVVSSKDAGLINVKDSLTFMKLATCVSSNKLMRMNPYSVKNYFKEELLMEIYTNVEILFIESPSCIYVRKNLGYRTEFNKMIHKIMKDYEQVDSCDNYISAPYKDLPCAAQGIDGRWHRGIICEATENTVKVFFVDKGYSLILSYNGIRTLPQKYMSCRTQAIKLSLRHIKPLNGSGEQWEPETIEYLKKYIVCGEQVTVIPLDRFGDTYSVIMYTTNNINVSELLTVENLVMTTKICPSVNKTTKYKRRKQKRILSHVHELMQPKNPQMQECSKETLPSLSATTIMNTDIMNSSVTNSSVTNPSEMHSSEINSSGNRIEIKEKEDPFKVEVVVHLVESPDCIYVSDATGERGNIDNMTKQMQQFYSLYHSTDPENWNLGAVCAVKLPSDNMYYRGKIVEMKLDDQVVVFLYDIGIETMVPKKNLQLLYPPFFKVPTCVFKIKLAGILPCGGSDKWPSLSCEELKEITNTDYSCKFYISKLEDEIVKDSVIPVELWVKQNKTGGPLSPSRIEINSINRMLVEKGVALPIKEYAKKRDKILGVELKLQLTKKLKRFSKNESDVKWFKINNKKECPDEAGPNKETETYLQYFNSSSEDTEEHALEEIENIPSLSKLTAWLPAEDILEDTFIAVPTYLDHDGFIYLHSEEKSTKTLLEIENKLQKLYKNCEIESCDTAWAVGDICIAEYHANKKWYRGKVMKILENDMVEVEFVDYGNIEECSIGTLKKKVVLENIPIQCTKCLIHGLISDNANGKWTTHELDRIHNLLIDKKCVVSVLNRTEMFYIISINIYLNEQTNNTNNLISFLIDNWKFCIKHDIESAGSKQKLAVTNTSNVISVDNSSDEEVEEVEEVEVEEVEEVEVEEVEEDTYIIPQPNVINNIDSYDNDSIGTEDTENLSWSRIKDNFVASTPCIVSEENLAMNYESFNIPKTIEYIQIELCCSITATKFHAQLKENEHSVVLNAYYRQYKQLMKDLEENASKQPMITNIIPNTPCCARFEDNVWYRCLIIEVGSTEDSGDIEVKLLYVDYGNDEYRKVNPQKSELHYPQKDWINVPTLAIKCKLWNVEMAPSANLNILLPKIEKMYEKPVIATIKEVDGEFTSVELYEDKDRKELLYISLINEGLFKTIVN